MVLESVLRETLATVEAQRDDAISYLGIIRSVLGALRRMPGLRACAREVATILIQDLHAESCAVLVRGEGSARSAVLGFATQAEHLGAPAEPYGVETWIELADQVGARDPLVWLKPSADGGYEPLAPGELAGESFQVIPFTIGDERRGAIVLHRLVAPAQTFGSDAAMPLIASAIGEALTIAQTRDTTGAITEKLEAELGLTRSSIEAHEESLLERERTIGRLTDAVVHSNRVKREFLAVISHELRTPLNAIVGFASLLEEDFAAGDTSEEQREMMHAILDRAHHLTALIEDVLLYVDLDAGRGRGPGAEIDLCGLVDEVSGTIERDESSTVELSVEVADSATHPRVDAQLVRRMLFHLLGNALKFTERGRVSLVVRPADMPGAIELVVQDTGPGMPQSRVAAMFELFQQGDSSSRRRHEGLGLGLALVQRAVHVLGGEITVQSTPGIGTTVRVVLPNALESILPAAALRS